MICFIPHLKINCQKELPLEHSQYCATVTTVYFQKRVLPFPLRDHCRPRAIGLHPNDSLVNKCSEPFSTFIVAFVHIIYW